GGMGEVYRARDTKLRRDVAIKVLPDLFGRDPERLARFEREAQTLPSLSHPNVAQVYGLVDVPPEGGNSGHASTGQVMDLVDRATREPDRRFRPGRAPERVRNESGSRARHRPPRSEAGEREGGARRRGQGARLRAGEGARSRRIWIARRAEFSNNDVACVADG